MECRYVVEQNKVSWFCYEKYLGWVRKSRERTKMGTVKALASTLQSKWDDQKHA